MEFKNVPVGQAFTYAGPNKSVGPYVKIGTKRAFLLDNNQVSKESERVVGFKPRTKVAVQTRYSELVSKFVAEVIPKVAPQLPLSPEVFPWPPQTKTTSQGDVPTLD